MTKEKLRAKRGASGASRELLLDSRFEGLQSKSKNTAPVSDALNPCKKKKPETVEEKFAEKGWIILK